MRCVEHLLAIYRNSTHQVKYQRLSGCALVKMLCLHKSSRSMERILALMDSPYSPLLISAASTMGEQVIKKPPFSSLLMMGAGIFNHARRVVPLLSTVKGSS